MKILLIGEYSRLHNSLKEGLTQLGHDVTLIGDGDGFKDFPVDIKLKRDYETGVKGLLKKICYRLFKIDLNSLSIKRQFDAHKNKLVDYDVVQLINEVAFNTIPKVEKTLLEFLFKHNKNVFLLSCGCDVPSVDFAMKQKFKYSILTPFFEKKIAESEFYPVLKYVKKDYIELHHFMYDELKGVIATDMDYHLPLSNHQKYLGLIPNPINTDRISFTDNHIKDKIVIFHGINSANYYKKGNDLFEAALQIIATKYPNTVDVITTTDIPYDQYINLYNKAHILMDQVYAYDQGYNALEAMAKGKVVFTGAEQEWLDHYQLEKNTVAINAEPDVEKLVQQLEWLITHPEQIGIISKNARAFIEKEHHYVTISNMYINTWKTNSSCQ